MGVGEGVGDGLGVGAGVDVDVVPPPQATSKSTRIMQQHAGMTLCDVRLKRDTMFFILSSQFPNSVTRLPVQVGEHVLSSVSSTTGNMTIDHEER